MASALGTSIEIGDDGYCDRHSQDANTPRNHKHHCHRRVSILTDNGAGNSRIISSSASLQIPWTVWLQRHSFTGKMMLTEPDLLSRLERIMSGSDVWSGTERPSGEWPRARDEQRFDGYHRFDGGFSRPPQSSKNVILDRDNPPVRRSSQRPGG